MIDRAKLIEAIQGIGRRYDATAQQDAIESARRPGNKELASKAQISVAVADAAGLVARMACDQVNAHWPKDLK